MKKLVALTGAGISAESGIRTFREQGGLWEEYDIMEVASPEGWRKNPQLVLNFYNDRRRQLKLVKPNAGHLALFDLEKDFQVVVVTQNVDNLHEAAGSTRVMHLHGELLKVRSTQFPDLVFHWEDDLHMGDLCPRGSQLRPHIVWFGEMVPMMEKAVEEVMSADILLIVGTSMQVYPAAGLVHFANPGTPVYYIDPCPENLNELNRIPNLVVVPEVASLGVPEVVRSLRQT